MRIADLPPCGRRERETIGGKLPTVLYVRVSSSYHGKVVLKITAVLLKNSTALLIKQACLYEKQSKFSNPFKNALWGLRLCNRGRLLSVRPAPTLFDHLYASLHRAFGRSISASLPKPQTPFPGKGAILLGLPPLEPVGGYAPATPFLYNQEVYRQSAAVLLKNSTAFHFA